jgi:Flagellar motor protein
LTDYANNNDLSGKVSFFLSEEGLNISFTGSVLFDKGKADLRREAIPALKEVANYLHKVPNYIGVAGSTDDLKISTEQFPSNWELSVIRATNCCAFSCRKGGNRPPSYYSIRLW